MRVIGGIVIMIMYYCNVSYAAYMPINSNNAFDNTMQSYNVSKVLTPDNRVDLEGYKAYGPPYYGVCPLSLVFLQFPVVSR